MNKMRKGLLAGLIGISGIAYGAYQRQMQTTSALIQSKEFERKLRSAVNERRRSVEDAVRNVHSDVEVESLVRSLNQMAEGKSVAANFEDPAITTVFNAVKDSVKVINGLGMDVATPLAARAQVQMSRLVDDAARGVRKRAVLAQRKQLNSLKSELDKLK